MDFKHSSRKAWSQLRKLGAANPCAATKPAISPNSIAAHIVSLSKVESDKNFTSSVNQKLKQTTSKTPKNSSYSRPFSVEEGKIGLSSMKNGTAAGVDGIYAEFLTFSGPRVNKWLALFYTDIITSGKLPKSFKKAKILALQKPKKPSDDPKSYRPIALLSVCLKLLERLILNRIGPEIDKVIPQEQAGFRPSRSCTDQVLALTNYVQDGFQNHLKSAVTFVDLTAAYDTVWKKGLILKLLKVIPCLKIADIICAILSDRLINVHLNEKVSKTRKLNNGLPQGSVLAPTLFNLYIHDLPC